MSLITFASSEEPQTVIPRAREMTRQRIAQIAEAGRLQDAALDQKRVVAQIAMGPLSSSVIRKHVTIAMLERWVMEAISTQTHHSSRKGC